MRPAALPRAGSVLFSAAPLQAVRPGRGQAPWRLRAPHGPPARRQAARILLAALPLPLFLHSRLPHAAAAEEAIRVRYEFAPPAVERTKDFHRLHIPGLANRGAPGCPLLPGKLARILLPPGTTPERVAVHPSPPEKLDGRFRIEPAAAGHSPIENAPLPRPLPDPAVYRSTALYPAEAFEILGVGCKHECPVLLLDLHPLRYRPARGEVTFSAALEVEVFLAASSGPPAAALPPQPVQRPGPAFSQPARADLRALVDNPELVDQLGAIGARPGTGDRAAKGAGGGAERLSHVIITSAELAPAFEPLSAARTAGGLPSRIVTTEWIYSRYDGTRPDGGEDDATRIREFIRDAYATDGLLYVLLGGDADGSAACAECEPPVVPARYFQTAPFANPIPSDLYYGCLDGSFDGDGDGLYGEPNDGEDGGDVDFLFEVHVGRMPVDSLEEAANLVRKTLAYEEASGPVLRRVLLAGEYLGFGGDYDWGGNLSDQILSGSEAFISTAGFANSPHAEFFAIETLYDRDSPGGRWAPERLIERIEAGVHILNHIGHADISHVMKLTNAEIDALDNDHPFLGYTQSCYAAAFDNQRLGGGYGPDSVVEHFLAAPAGAAAFVANSRRGWAGVIDADGPSHRFNRRFWDAVFRHGIVFWGAANDRSKEESIADIQVNDRARWVAYELHTLGDPALALKLSSRRGSLAWSERFYNPGHPAGLTLIDADLDTSPLDTDRAVVEVEAEVSGDREEVELAETGRSSGVFRVEIALQEGPAGGDGTVEVSPPDRVVARYRDVDRGDGTGATVEAGVAVVAPPGLAGPCPLAGAIGRPLSVSLEATGGVPPYRFAAEEGYTEELGPPLFDGLGVAQNWTSDEGSWAYSLPFDFPFYGRFYQRVLVSSNGYLELGQGSGLDFDNSLEALARNTRIAPLWADLVTAGGGDIYIQEEFDSVSIRWHATGYHTAALVSAEVELFADGTIRFGYGEGNRGLSPTIGISAGDGRYLLSPLSGRADLGGASSVLYLPTRLPRGLAVEPESGVVAGMPVEPAADEVTFRVEDTLGQSARLRCSVAVRPDGIIVESPREGDLWLAGSEQTIRWQWFGRIGTHLRLDYNTDGSATGFPLAIAASVPAVDRAFTWRLPAATAARVRIRIQSVELSEFTTHSAVFSIVGPTLRLLDPGAGAIWVAGDRADVRWVSLGDTGSRFRLDYNTDGSLEAFPLSLAADTAAAGGLSLQVPPTPSETCRLRLRSLSVPGVEARSELVAIRLPALTLTSPNGGECLRSGETVQVTWSSLGNTGAEVLLDYDADGSETYPFPVGDGPLPNTGSAGWELPAAAGDSFRLRIRSALSPALADTSDGPFRLAARCGLRVLVWVPGIDVSEEQVRGVVAALERVEPGSEVSFSTTVAPSALRAELAAKDAFVVPKQKQAGDLDLVALGDRLRDVLARFVEAGGALVACEQPANADGFLTATGLLVAERQGGGERLCEVISPRHPLAAGVRPNFPGPRSTSWYSVGDPDATLVVRAHGGETVVASRGEGFGRVSLLGFDYYAWNDDTARLLGGAARVPLPLHGVRLIEPRAGSLVHPGDDVLVRWHARGEADGAALIAYNTDGSRLEFPFPIGEAASAGGQGSFAWRAPPPPPGRALLEVGLQVRSRDHPEHADSLAAPLRVARPLAIITEVLPGASVGLEYAAEVRVSGGVPPYRYEALGLPAGLAAFAGPSGALAIEGIPQRECLACAVEVSVEDALGQQDRRRFELPVLERRIAVTRPRAGDLWLFGSEEVIRWTGTGSLGATVRLSYNTDGAADRFPFPIVEAWPIDTPYTWELPIVDAPRVRIRVESEEFPEVFGLSGVFTIAGPSLRLDVPNGGECWSPGRRRTILWRSAGGGGEPVRLEYVPAATGQYQLIAQEVPDTGSYDWIVPAVAGGEARVRVSFQEAPLIRDESDAPFAVRPDCSRGVLLWSPCDERMIESISSILRGAAPEAELESAATRDPAVLEAALANRDVLVVLLMEGCDRAAAYEALGRALAGALADFTRAGGGTVLAGTDPRSAAFASALGLVESLQVARAGSALPCQVRSFLHPLVRRLPLEFTGPPLTFAYHLAGGGFESLVEADGFPVVAARDDGLGRWVLLGFDYAVPSAESVTLLADSLRLEPVVPGLRLLAPGPGGVFAAGGEVRVRWAARSGREEPLLLRYNTDGGTAAFPFEVARVQGASGDLVYEVLWQLPEFWEGPDPPPREYLACRLEVSWEGEPRQAAVAEGAFFVVRRALELVTESLPRGFQGAEYRAEVEVAGGVPPFTVDATGLPAGLLATAPEERTIAITGVPRETGTDRLVVLAATDALGSASERHFSLDVLPSRLRIVEPRGGEFLLAGSEHPVRWEVEGYVGETVRIEYNLDGSLIFPFLAAPEVPVGQDFSWQVPDVDAARCRLRVVANELGQSAATERPFAISGPGITCLFPNGGERLETGTVRTIRWRSLGNRGGAVHVEWDAEGAGTFLGVVAQDLPDTGTYAWEVPSLSAQDVRVRVRSAADPALADTSDAPFAIVDRAALRGLVWAPYETSFAQEEVRGAIAAVTTVEFDFEWWLSKATRPEELASELWGTETFLMVEQAPAAQSFRVAARALGPVLEEFVEHGGTVVVLKQAGGAQEFLAEVGLLDVHEAGRGFDVVCRVVWPGHPVVNQVAEEFRSATATAWYEVGGEAVEVYATTLAGEPVVLGRPLGDGRVVVIGFDYRDYTEASARIIANALRNTPPTERTPFVRGDANGDARVNLADAVYILRYLFSRRWDPACLDALDVNDSAFPGFPGSAVEMADAVELLSWLFAGGRAPAPPAPRGPAAIPESCGVDPQFRDGLSCESYPPCGD